HQMWNGWSDNADPLSRLCYRLSKMQNLDMWAGSIVHDCIQGCLQRIRCGTDPMESAAAMQEEAVNRLRQGWIQSKNEKWRTSPKWNLNLFSHYYGLEIPKSRTDQIKTKILTCLENFARSSEFELVA